MKFVLWARYNKLSPFILTSRENFTTPIEPEEISVDGLEFALEVKAMSNGRNKQAS